MRTQYIMFMGFIFAIGTLVSLTFGGVGMSSTETSVVNSLTVFKQANILGTWSVMVPNISFFTTGMKSLMMMDFAFFSNMEGMEIIQWLLFMTLGVGMLWGIYTVVIGVIQGLFRRA